MNLCGGSLRYAQKAHSRVWWWIVHSCFHGRGRAKILRQQTRETLEASKRASLHGGVGCCRMVCIRGPRDGKARTHSVLTWTRLDELFKASIQEGGCCFCCCCTWSWSKKAAGNHRAPGRRMCQATRIGSLARVQEASADQSQSDGAAWGGRSAQVVT